MKQFFLLCFFSIPFLATTGQDFSGQWKGTFIDKSTSFNGFGGDACDYVLELECKGSTVSGASYTYFTDGGKKYYTICKLEGFVDRANKFIEVVETKRTKTNVPVHIRNCFQVHRLSYQKHGDSAILKGKWEPAPNQDGDCGIGNTMLVRRELKSTIRNHTSKTSTSKPKQLTEKPVFQSKKSNTGKPDVAKHKRQPKKLVAPMTVAPANDLKQQNVHTDSSSLASKQSPTNISASPLPFEKRVTTVLKTFRVENPRVKVDLYDNGEVDGDSVSLFYNGKLLMASKRLCTRPLTLNIDVEEGDVNQLVMYAENLGTISPNTALMVVTDGSKRYEVRITSDLQKSGVINFVRELKAKTPPAAAAN